MPYLFTSSKYNTLSETIIPLMYIECRQAKIDEGLLVDVRTRVDSLYLLTIVLYF